MFEDSQFTMIPNSARKDLSSVLDRAILFALYDLADRTKDTELGKVQISLEEASKMFCQGKKYIKSLFEKFIKLGYMSIVSKGKKGSSSIYKMSLMARHGNELDTNRKPIGNELETNMALQQTDIQDDTKEVETNWKRIGNELETNWKLYKHTIQTNIPDNSPPYIPPKGVTPSEFVEAEEVVFEEKPNVKKRTKKELSYDFVDDQYRDVFMQWIDYKREKKQGYKTQQSLEQCYNKMLRDSNRDIATMREMIEYSIAMNYTGFFLPKEGRKVTEDCNAKNAATLSEHTADTPYGKFLHYIANNSQNVIRSVILPTNEEFEIIRENYQPIFVEALKLMDGDANLHKTNFWSAFISANNKLKYASNNGKQHQSVPYGKPTADERFRDLQRRVAEEIISRSDGEVQIAEF